MASDRKASASCRPGVFPRRLAVSVPEDTREMRLIGEAGVECDHRQRLLGAGESDTGLLQLSLPDVLGYGSPVITAEGAQEMPRMHAGQRRELLHRWRRRKAGVDGFLDAPQPARARCRARIARSRQLRKHEN